MILYLDMDDVVADWRTAVEDFLQLKFPNGDQWARLPDHEWDKVKNNSRLYRNLPLKENASDLVNFCLKAKDRGEISDIFFLSAIPRRNDMPWAIQDKVWWAHEYFPTIPVFLGPYSADKWQRCNPGDLLIDDRESNCVEWRQAGGYAHIYSNWKDCKPWLEQQIEGARQAAAWIKDEYYE